MQKCLIKRLGNIDWTKSAVEIERLVRGLNSWPSAYTYWNRESGENLEGFCDR